MRNKLFESSTPVGYLYVGNKQYYLFGMRPDSLLMNVIPTSILPVIRFDVIPVDAISLDVDGKCFSYRRDVIVPASQPFFIEYLDANPIQHVKYAYEPDDLCDDIPAWHDEPFMNREVGA